MTTWPTSCGSMLWNPYCLASGPTDPYSWYYYNGTWSQAMPWTPTVTTPNGAAVIYNNQIYYCNAGPCTGAVGDDVNGYQLIQNMQNLTDPTKIQLSCTSSGPTPDPQTGSCQPSALNGQDAACVNPCIRLPNGTLAVNKNSAQCRVFPNTTPGGNGGGTDACPTVCPQQCVELWQTCPPGTAPLATLVQTKTPDDLMSLLGPYDAKGDLNTLWPANYATTVSGIPAIGGKPYTECYSYNTEFCELPMAIQETTSGSILSPLGQPSGPQTVCYSPCPPGTVPDGYVPHKCVFAPTNGPYDPLNYTVSTPVQKVFCNPQYFNPVYWTTIIDDVPVPTSIQQGCQAKGIPAKQGSTCPAGTSPILNDNFNIEWCVPECPTGYVADLSQSTCIATCDGAYAQPDTTQQTNPFNIFLDYIDFYATKDRCVQETYTNGVTTYTQEKDCVQNNTNGRCPALQHSPMTTSVLPYDYNTDQPHDVLWRHDSINTQCNEKRYRDWRNSKGQAVGSMNKIDYENWRNHLDRIQRYQSAHPNGPNKISKFFGKETKPDYNRWVECPTGMKSGNSACSENEALCYDECNEGYDPVTFCSNGAKTCAPEALIYACRARCPSSKEGLGPWVEVNADPLFTCAYQYPQGNPPSDPNLWVQCPDDGRYTTLTSSPADNALSVVARKEPLCIRNQYLRQQSCPMGFNAQSAKDTGQTICTKACNSDEIVVTLPSGNVVCQTSLQHSKRHEMDLVAVADTESTREPFRSRVLKRNNFTRARGIDPNQGLEYKGPTDAVQTWTTYGTYGVVGVGALLALRFFSK